MADASQAAHSEKAQDLVDHFAVIESYIESFHVQCFIVLLLLYDVSAAALEMYLRSYIRLSECGQLAAVHNLTVDKDLCTATSCPWTLWGINILLRLTGFGSGFTQTLFLLEITLLLAIKKKSIQIPYVFDLIILILAMAYEVYAQSGVFRLLGVFRIAWRVYAQMIKLLSSERAQHQETGSALNEMTLKYVEMQLNANAMQTRLEKEYETREDWKGLIEGYKDEIETLRDALEIAAMEIAQAKQLPEETLTGRKQMFNFESDNSIYHVKEALQEKEGIQVNQIRLIYSGRQLSDKKTLRDYSVVPGGTIHMVLQLRGGQSLSRI